MEVKSVKDGDEVVRPSYIALLQGRVDAIAPGHAKPDHRIRELMGVDVVASLGGREQHTFTIQ